MIEKKFNWKIYFFIILFGGILLLVSHVIILLTTNQVVDERGSPLPSALIVSTCFIFVLICSTYFITFLSLLRQVIIHKNAAFKIDNSGIHNTVVFINLFAFVIVSNIKFIPWSSVHYMDIENNSIYIRVKPKQVSASLMGRIVIGIMGYSFCQTFTKKGLSKEEIDLISIYCISQSPYLSKK